MAQSPGNRAENGFLSLDGIKNLVSPEILWLGIAMVAIIAALAAIILLVKSRNGAVLQKQAYEAQQAVLEKELAEARYFAASAPAIHIVWQGEEDKSPKLSGTLPDVDGVPVAAAEILEFKNWIEAEGCIRFNKALDKLKSWGTPFNLFVKTRAGVNLEADGRATGDRIAVRFQGLAGKMQELSELSQACSRYQNDVSSLRTLLNTSTAPAWLRGADGTISWVNASYAAAVEAKTPEDAVGGAVELIGASDRKAIRQELDETGASRRQIYTIVKGQRRSFDLVATKTACGSAALAVDMTGFDELRDEIKRHVKAHEQTLDQLKSAVAIFGSDQKLQYFNAACQKLWGLEEKWLRSSPGNGEILDRLRVNGRLPDEVDFHLWKKQQLAIYASVTPHEDWWHLPDGRTLRVVCEPHAFGGVTWLFEDVTEKHKLESRFKTLVSVQRETLDHLREGVAMFGTHGRLQLFNPAFTRMWQLEEESLAALPHIDAVSQQCLPLFDEMAIWNDIKADITSLGIERKTRNWRIELRDGRVFDAFLVPLPAGSSLLAFVDETASARAAEALRQRAEALEAADRIKTAFVGHVSYQLREPLTSIIGFNEMLASGTFGEMNEKQSEYVANIGKASATLDNVITDILDLATIDAGVMELNPVSVNIAEALEKAGNLFKERLVASGLRLHITIFDDKSTIMADEQRLKQVLFNLLSNAINFSPEGSIIEMGAEPDGDFFRIWVRDQGGGIDPGLDDKVFDRFEPDGKNSGHRGAGLGLAIVKGFVELHGGNAEIRSGDKGTTVTCRFPIEGPAAAKKETAL